MSDSRQDRTHPARHFRMFGGVGSGQEASERRRAALLVELRLRCSSAAWIASWRHGFPDPEVEHHPAQHHPNRHSHRLQGHPAPHCDHPHPSLTSPNGPASTPRTRGHDPTPRHPAFGLVNPRNRPSACPPTAEPGVTVQQSVTGPPGVFTEHECTSRLSWPSPVRFITASEADQVHRHCACALTAVTPALDATASHHSARTVTAGVDRRRAGG